MTAPHDPTRAGAPVPDGAALFSRSEIEAVCMKAARGAGLPWGLAEEAGMAARRLAEAGLPGPEWLLAYLEGPRGRAPAIGRGHWRPEGEGGLCPIATGAALSDRAGRSEPLPTLHHVLHPGLLLPFLIHAAGAGAALRADWGTGAALAGAAGIDAPHEVPAQGDVLLSRAGAMRAPPRHTGRWVPLDLWRRLNALALFTTVPATERSRAGAGAGPADND